MWIFRQLPIVSLHPNAKTKAIASECAARQGGDATFWSYADELYDKGGEIALNTNELEKLLEGIAGDNQLDTTKFKRCLLNKETIGKVNNDIETSKTAKATGTPATYLMNLNTGQTLALNGAVSLQVLLNTLQILK
jgi:protein-disulfide isomerase